MEIRDIVRDIVREELAPIIEGLKVGAQGPQGTPGQPGEVGERGPRGRKGDTGEPGQPGETPSIAHLEAEVHNLVNKVETRLGQQLSALAVLKDGDA